MKRPMMRILIVSIMVVAALTRTNAQQERKIKPPNQSVGKTSQTTLAAILNINNFTIWQQAHGRGAYPPNNAGDGGVYPRGTRWVIFADGFVWAAKAYVDPAHTIAAPVQLIRVGGSTYNVGNEVGWIEGEGPNARGIGPADPRARIYRIRRDWTTMSKDELRRDAAENNLIPLNDVTEADWDEWPVEHGAPYIERNGIPGYQKPPTPSPPSFTPDMLITKSFDEPGIAGPETDFTADQVIWCAFNDLNRGNLIGFTGSEPIGLELQMTLWGYKQHGAMGEMYFKRLLLINKGGADISGGEKGFLWLDSMFVGMWSDPDIGYFGDDLVGCDSVLGIGYAYTGRTTDAEFDKFLLPPPAAGYAYLQGGLVPSEGDTAIFDLKPRAGYRNLPMTSFALPVFATQADYPYGVELSRRWWRVLQGYVPDPSGSPWRLFPHPPGFPITKFPFSGNPVTGTGFIDGLGTDYSPPPGDRRLLVNTGPFQLAPLDTQEVVVAVVGGMGSDRLSSITVMKANVQVAHLAYQSLFTTPRAPRAPRVMAVELDGQIILEWGSNP
ncbi:MAG: hypothetical protein HYW57_09560, partial [Ignavibacteriales bacterium]|nr:hypothetical protein [Ignavibacteriales bacterium]